MVQKKIDPITLEVIRNRLKSIAEEMFIVVKKTAASPLYTESNDYSLGLFDANNNFIQLGGTACFHYVALKSIVQESIKLLGDDPGIFDGDIIMANDAFGAGGIHSLDLGLISPIYFDGKFVGWTGSIAQQMDIGGMTPGGFNLEAMECYQEGLRFSPMKLYERGKLRKDLWQFYLNNVRLADKQAIDLRGQISANMVGNQRIQELCREFGVETFQSACEVLRDIAESNVRERIKQLPNGVYEACDYEEHDGKNHDFFKVKCTLTVEEDEVSFDFTGTCGQVPAPINCTKIGLDAAVYAGFMPSLCWDLPWNEGVAKPVKISAPEGTIISAVVPAPVSMPSSMMRAMEAAMKCLHLAIDASPFFKQANSSSMGMWPIIVAMGFDQYKRPTLIPWMDGGLGGMGAFSSRDGVDNASMLLSMNVNICDVEWSENYYPLLYLERKIKKDSDGAGKYRGGVGIEVVATPYDTDWLMVTNLGTRKYFAGYSLSGGLPGGQNIQLIKRNVDISERMKEEVPGWLELPQQVEVPETKSRFTLLPGDIFYFVGGGGGGYGDPIDRNQEDVKNDVKWGYISLEKAREIYGVVLDQTTLKVNWQKTEERREQIRRDRLK